MQRAVCEKCGEVQPRDSEAAAACVACGAPVRAEARCAWCARWTPQSRFCRGCGAEIVPSQDYGAARMLKAAGVDRFSILKRLHELDPAQVESFAQIYAV